MKKTLILIPVLCIGLCLSGQNLYVQPINGEQVAFSLAGKPKITFGNGTMTIETQMFQLSEVQNLSFVFNPPTSIEMHLTNEQIFVFPNPVNDELSIVVQNLQGKSFRIFDVSGRLLKSDQIHSTTTIINVQNFPAGTYVLHINRNGVIVQTLQIIKQ